jgi:hypothetical protein
MARMISHTPIVFDELSSLDQEKLLACFKLYLGYMFEVMKKEEAKAIEESGGTIQATLPDRLFFMDETDTP